MIGFCELCAHNWHAHDDGTDDYDWCRVKGCRCDGFVAEPSLDFCPACGHHPAECTCEEAS
jgi:hypothetical protein